MTVEDDIVGALFNKLICSFCVFRAELAFVASKNETAGRYRLVRGTVDRTDDLIFATFYEISCRIFSSRSVLTRSPSALLLFPSHSLFHVPHLASATSLTIVSLAATLHDILFRQNRLVDSPSE